MQKYFGKFCTIHGLIRVLHVGTQAESRSDSACKIFLTNCIQITKKCSQKLKNIWNILKLILFRKNAYLSTWLLLTIFIQAMYMLIMSMYSHVSNVHVDNEHVVMWIDVHNEQNLWKWLNWLCVDILEKCTVHAY